MASNPNNLGPDPDGTNDDNESTPGSSGTLMERWETKHTFVVIGAIVLIYFAYKKMK